MEDNNGTQSGSKDIVAGGSGDPSQSSKGKSSNEAKDGQAQVSGPGHGLDSGNGTGGANGSVPESGPPENLGMYDQTVTNPLIMDDIVYQVHALSCDPFGQTTRNNYNG